MSASSKKGLLEVHNLKKTYWNGTVAIPAVRGVDLTILEGEFVAFMGPSGSGKSTLMNLLAFLDAPSSGSYSFSAVNIEDFDEDYRAELRNATIGFVFQQFHLLPRTTALDNVRLPLMYAGVKRKLQKERAYEALRRVGLTDRLFHRPNELSGGQQQRVSIARALVNNPTVLFCDEPTGNLDSKTAEEIMNILSALHQDGVTIIMVTHEPDIAAYADRIIHMKDGKIIKS
ncbi:MAG: macrolide ABC transporter ATP-binding protein [Candidatus Kerfeldbacteria bacterium RIFOXYA2_FULL_38_24]|uniref:Macrolide ABC transporter ATP-binding protein n=1 Tax=Candidatus Kerfeldbacteria bacterium RIFOXYB2_FULL_38_14 TaxID=1798547 RepID=A0A1G2BBN2_9BACT|nr:MAG: macrolide ABC transporter ATP-binding protein [Candidatus Kerfeldbacteria bacterium RIFOXYA2_FULL_38_24]OGY86435.1 MAG: macrolide ABC transporter ATP-binding protein [Candidatus Kerfeldbacteria bacterium RIFOXYB2_FULL_38_14]OGY88423.1 MAG: macrolide ABC transporter ATP-binding protein [Candidatus Kerfeldbacteria bacterium RIFOXYC2_FULL_38_9]